MRTTINKILVDTTQYLLHYRFVFVSAYEVVILLLDVKKTKKAISPSCSEELRYNETRVYK